MLNPSELFACDFPLWKRGTKGDLRSLSTRKREKSASTRLFQRGKRDAEITCRTNIVNFNKLPGCHRAYQHFAMLNPSELFACDFPLWKRGTKGDLRSLSTRKREKFPSIPPSARLGQALFKRGTRDAEITCETNIVNFNKLPGCQRAYKRYASAGRVPKELMQARSTEAIGQTIVNTFRRDLPKKRKASWLSWPLHATRDVDFA